MTLKIASNLQNAALDGVFAAIGSGATLRIRSGDAPGEITDADAGAVLASITLPDPYVVAAASGEIQKAGTWQDNSAAATGTAGHFRIYDSADQPRLQGTITATDGGGDLELDDVDIETGGIVVVSGFSVQFAPPAEAATAPLSVSDLSVSSAGLTSVALVWTAPDNGGSAITDYVIEFREPAGAWSTFSDGVSSTAGVTVTGLTEGTAYEFRVSAVNAVGQATSSNVATGSTTTTLAAPDAVNDLSAMGGNGQVALLWTAPAANGAPITDYRVEYRETGGTWAIFADAVNSATGATVTGLANGTEYEFRVSAQNSQGFGSTSNVATATPVVMAAPGAVSDLSGVALSGGVDLSWSAPTANGSAITDYVVEFRLLGAGSYTTFSDGTSAATSASVTGLTAGSVYQFRVSAVNGVGTGSPSNVIAVAVPSSFVPSGANFALSATDEAIWRQGATSDAGENADILSPSGSSFTNGTNPLVSSSAGAIAAAASGQPRRSYDGVAAAWGYTTAAAVPLMPNGGPVPPALLNLGLTFDYEVDPVGGNDANDGTFGSGAVATLARMQAILNGLSSGTHNVIVRQGDYVDDPFLLNALGATINLVFEPNTTIRSTDVSIGVNNSTQAIDIVQGTVNLYGNGLHVRDWKALQELGTNDLQNSSNAFAAHGAGELNVHDARASNCGDGFTAHSDATLRAYRCIGDSCDKATVAHVNASTTYHEDCIFIGGDGHINSDVRAPVGVVDCGDGAGTHQFVRCRFDRSPADGSNNRIACDETDTTVTIDRCQIGTWDTSMRAEFCDITDSFVNIGGDIHRMAGTMTRLYGKMGFRLRPGNAVAITDSIIVGPPSSGANIFATSFLDDSFDFGSQSQITIARCVITGFTSQPAIDLSNARLSYWQAAGSTIDDCTFFGNTNDYSADAATEVGSSITNISSADPQLGTYTSSVTMSDYAATSGTTHGFNTGEAVVTGPPEAANDNWTIGSAAGLGVANGDTVRLVAPDDSTTDVTVAGGVVTVPAGHWKLIHGPFAA